LINMAHSVYLLTCYSPKSNKSCQSRHTRRCEKLVENIKYFFSAYVIFGKVFVSFPPRNGVGKATLRWNELWGMGFAWGSATHVRKNPPPQTLLGHYTLWTMVCEPWFVGVVISSVMFLSDFLNITRGF